MARAGRWSEMQAMGCVSIVERSGEWRGKLSTGRQPRKRRIRRVNQAKTDAYNDVSAVSPGTSEETSMAYPIDPKLEADIEAAVLQSIKDIVTAKARSAQVEDPEAIETLLKSSEEGYKIGKYIIDQIPYASLNVIDFPPLPEDNQGQPNAYIETELVQRYGPLNKYWTRHPFVNDDGTFNVDEGEYQDIPIGFPVQFGQKRYTNEGFQGWRMHNGIKAIRFQYRVFPSRPIGRPAHITVFYSGGDH